MRIVKILSMLAVLLALGTVAIAQGGQISLTAAGATFPYPMYSKWFNEYNKLHPNIQINYQSIGSGGGIKQVTEGTVDFGATDGPMNDKQIARVQAQEELRGPAFPHCFGRRRSNVQCAGYHRGAKLHSRSLGRDFPWENHEME